MRQWLALSVGMLIADASPALAGPCAEELARALQQRFQPSRIEVRDPGRAGAVTRTGRGVVLAVDAVPARPLQVRDGRHVLDSARVVVARDGAVRKEAAPLTLPRGTKWP